MPEVEYLLRFEREQSGKPTAGEAKQLSQNAGLEQQLSGAVSYDSTFTMNPDGIRFQESGTITFEGTGGPHTLSFGSVGDGLLFPALKSAATGMTPGTVMWSIGGGTGVFDGAQGTITSNFRVNIDTEALRDDQVAWIVLPG